MWLEAVPFERANCVEGAQHTNNAIIRSRVRNGVNVRAGSDWGESPVLSRPAAEEIADGVLVQFKPGLLAKFFDESPAAQISFRKQDACNDRRWRFRNGSESIDLLLRPERVDGERAGHGLTRYSFVGWPLAPGRPAV